MKKAIQAIVTVAVCLLVALMPRIARAGGTLYLAKGGQQGSELPLERTDVQVDVSGSVVSASVSQRFTNSSREPIEVIYIFPLPQRAAVDAMEMKVGARTVKATIAKREEARAAYDQALRNGQRAALLEQERPNVFTFNVGNIDPGAAIEVKLHYFEVDQFDAGTYDFAVPTTVGPRFNPETVTDANRISPTYSQNGGAKLGVRVHLDAGVDLEKIDVPTHLVDVARPNAHVADVKTKNDDVPNRDFVFKWRVAADTVKPAVFAHRPKTNEHGYVTLILEPKHDTTPTEIAARELVFLLDTSGSMQGPPLEASIAAVRKAVDSMGPNDTFQIIDFADVASQFAPRPLPNTPENRFKAHNHLAHLTSGGGTNQLVGIHAALSTPGDDMRVRYVMFFTDGYIGNEAEVLALTRREIGRARIFSFGVGASVNRYLLDEVAIAGRGFAEYLRPREDAKKLVDRFYQRIGKPYLTDVEIDWNGLAIEDAQPAKLPDLSAFSPLVVHARYAKAGKAQVTIKGRVGMRPFATKLDVVLPESEPNNAAISRLWAREKIAQLERHPEGMSEDAAAITRIALAHDLVSKYTSFVAIDVVPRANAIPGTMPSVVNQPNEAPADVDLRSAGGTVAYGSAPMPAESLARAELASPPPFRSGGCAGCMTSSAHDPVSSGAGLLGCLAGVAIIAIRRKKRGYVDRSTP